MDTFYEIERKFLLSSAPSPPPEDVIKAYGYSQGYVPGNLIKERVTVIYSTTNRYLRAVKIGSGLERLEFNEEISEPLFQSLWDLTKKRRIHKHRTVIKSHDKRVSNLYWEVDRYKDRELHVAEIEIPNAAHQIVIPKWLKPLIIREVTEEKAFEGFFMCK